MTSIVMKFGGAALADGASVQRACRIVAEASSGPVIVVVSAHRGVTSLLDEVARSAVRGERTESSVRIRHRSLLAQLGLDPEFLNRFWLELTHLVTGIVDRRAIMPQERDLILSLGERVSARIVAQALRAEGTFATPVDAFDLGLTVDGAPGDPVPHEGSRTAMRKALAEIPGVPVVTGFLARDAEGYLTTLGRNGSDWTASLIAEAVNADQLLFWKTVGGVMTADPRIVPNARVLEELSWEDAYAFARAGAEVLHPEAVEPARRASVAVQIKDATDADAPGTTIRTGDSSTSPIGIACKNGDGGTITLVGGSAADGEIERRTFEVLNAAGVTTRFDPRVSDQRNRTFRVEAEDLARAVRTLHDSWFGV